MHVVSAALHARGRPVLGVLRVAVLRPAHAAVQAVPRVVPRVHRPGPVQLLGVHVPAAPGQEELAVRVVLRTAGPRRLLQLQRGDGRVPQPDARGEAAHVRRERAGQPAGRRRRRVAGALGPRPRARRRRVRLPGAGHVRRLGPGRLVRIRGECDPAGMISGTCGGLWGVVRIEGGGGEMGVGGSVARQVFTVRFCAGDKTVNTIFPSLFPHIT